MPLPFSITIRRNQVLKFDPNQIGFYCWHDYQSNSRTIAMAIAEDNQHFVDWDTFLLDKKAGESLFKIKPIPAKYQFYRFTILNNYGDDVTYLNSLTLYYSKELKLHRTLESRLKSQISF